ncbi:MAG: chromate efflux transporter [Chloroflexota bacterium]|nr:chromate efflux transporter [Chloroflexota bacterium]
MLEVLRVSTRLGLTSFGGPIAHIGYFREEYVAKRNWVDEHSYADIVALCQFLPGPASSQVGIAVGLIRAGFRGAIAAWLGFTLPSVLALLAFAYGVDRIGGVLDAGWLHGLKIVAVAVVAQAVYGMAVNLTPDRERITLAILAAVTVLAWSTAVSQVLVIIIAGVVGWRILPRVEMLPVKPLTVGIGRRTAIVSWMLFFGLLIGLPVLHGLTGGRALGIFDGFYRAGSLVFGGGHVVLPLLQAEVVPPGWVTNEEFIAGYGAAQAVPGPLTTFAAYLGAITWGGGNAWIGATIAIVAIFLPSFLLIVGALPFWDLLRARVDFQAALRGINAGVVGILLAALYDPVWTSAIEATEDFALGLVAFGLLVFWKQPPWLVVIFAAIGGEVISRL